MQAQIVVFEFPPRLSVKSRVSLLSLKGTCMIDFSLAKALMQLLKAAILLLIFLASYNLIPSEPVFESLSEPARSTIVKRAFLKCLFLYGPDAD